ncbi:putative glycosyltransferase family 71 protein [Coleophoma crateriformis]|uniref:Putative glycosyltransferase family 71 protein n=1 Tax=Coleophoma crateriformis TaxID=565419 RepID=A0A3D8T235_9HELO|nr:putative glycosyltransferase family 71 protein [Coleophoma crateriformis]
MAIPIGERPAQLAAISFVAALLYLAFLGRHLDLSIALNFPDRMKATIEQMTGSSRVNTSSITTQSDLAKDAHKFPTADLFLPHFAAVTQLQGMTMLKAKSGCSWPAMDEVNFQYSEDTEWAMKDRNDTELAFRREEWHDYINHKLLPYAQYQDRFQGRGIVICAGNQKSLKRVRVILRALKKLGSQMAIELHYWGDEMSKESQDEISSLWPKMFFNDLSESTNILQSNHDNIFHINYQLKTAAVINSRFAEPLLLDSDNIPVVDPESLYETAVYKEYGTLFWPDIARTRPNNPMWAITNTECRMDEYEQESGQLLVDKRRFFYHLQLAAWFNNDHGIYYNDFLLGDKDMFRFAWHALKTKYGSPAKWLTSVGTLSNGFYCGHTFAQHHPDGNIAFLHGGLVKTLSKEVITWQRESHGGIFQVYKRSEYDEQPLVNVNVTIKLDPASYMPNRPDNIAVALCTEFGDVVPRPLDEVVPGFQKTYEELGGYWMIE